MVAYTIYLKHCLKTMQCSDWQKGPIWSNIRAPRRPDDDTVRPGLSRGCPLRQELDMGQHKKTVAEPHSSQNLAAGLSRCPQLGQLNASAVPH